MKMHSQYRKSIPEIKQTRSCITSSQTLRDLPYQLGSPPSLNAYLSCSGAFSQSPPTANSAPAKVPPGGGRITACFSGKADKGRQSSRILGIRLQAPGRTEAALQTHRVEADH